MKQKSYKKNLDGSGRTRNDRPFVGVLGEHGERLRGRNLGEREKEKGKYGAVLEKKRMTKNRVDDLLNVLEIPVCWGFRLSIEMEQYEYV